MKKASLIVSGVLLALLLVSPAFLKNYGVYLLTTWMIFIIATMGLNLTVGYAGQKSLGHAAFFGIGAYTVAIMMKAGISFWVGLPAAALICFVVGIILGCASSSALHWAFRRCACRPFTLHSPPWASTRPSGC